MNVQKTRLLLRAVAITLLLISVAVVAWAVRSPHERIGQGGDSAPARRAGTRKAKLVSSPPLEDLAGVWGKELRRPLYDPPKAPKKTVPSDKKESKKKRRGGGNGSEGGLRLVGTMLEDGRSLAVFMNASGEIDLKGVGETLELAPGTRLDRIDPTEVTVSIQGRATTFRLPDTRVR